MTNENIFSIEKILFEFVLIKLKISNSLLLVDKYEDLIQNQQWPRL